VSSSIPAGLCARCAFQRLVGTQRGPTYSLCTRSTDEPDRYPRYPPLPVQACAGYQPRPLSER